MALKVKATEQMMKIGTYAGKYRYVMMPELYTALSQEKVPLSYGIVGYRPNAEAKCSTFVMSKQRAKIYSLVREKNLPS